MNKTVCCGLLAVVLGGCQSAPQRTPVPSTSVAPGPSPAAAHPEALVHIWSGMQFPETVANLTRGKAVKFDPQGKDFGVNYRLQTNTASMAATVYIYPLPGTDAASDALERNMACGSDMQKRKQELLNYHPDAVFKPLQDATLTQNGTLHRGSHLAYNTVEEYSGTPQNVSSDFYLFCFASSGWTIAYRFSYPSKTPVNDAIAQFMQQLAWPQ